MSVRLSVCPSVRPYPPFDSGSYRPIFKILFLFERYDMRYLTVIIFVRLSVGLSVRLSVRPSVCTPSSFRYYRPIFKILFLFERYDIRYLTLIIFVRPFICPFRTPLSISVPYPPFNFRSNNQIFNNNNKKNQESRLF